MTDFVSTSFQVIGTTVRNVLLIDKMPHNVSHQFLTIIMILAAMEEKMCSRSKSNSCIQKLWIHPERHVKDYCSLLQIQEGQRLTTSTLWKSSHLRKIPLHKQIKNQCPIYLLVKGARSKREKIRRNGRREKKSGKRNFDRLCPEDFQIREHRMILLLVTKWSVGIIIRKDSDQARHELALIFLLVANEYKD